jgi:hypothetical protein
MRHDQSGKTSVDNDSPSNRADPARPKSYSRRAFLEATGTAGLFASTVSVQLVAVGGPANDFGIELTEDLDSHDIEA